MVPILLILAFALLIIVILGLGLLTYALYALIGILLVSRWLSRYWSEHLVAERECNRVEAEIGQTIAVVLRLKNAGRLPVVWVLVEDLLSRNALLPPPPRLEVQGRRIHLLGLRAGGEKTLTYQLRCQGRGFFQIGPTILETGDLFGLHRRYRILCEPHFLTVLPELLPIEGYDIASRRPIGELRLTHRLYEDPTRIVGLRPYQRGDPLRRIHWPATARAGQLHSKLYEPSVIAGATLLVDLHAQSYGPPRGWVRAELAITCAASLAVAIGTMGQQIGLATNGRDAADRIRQEGWDYDLRSRRVARRVAEMLPESSRLQPVLVETRRGEQQVPRILQTLARIELNEGLCFDQLVYEVAGRLPRDATAIAIVPEANPETVIALAALRAQGMAVLVMINTYEAHDYAVAAERFLAEGIEARHLRDQTSITQLCHPYVLP